MHGTLLDAAPDVSLEACLEQVLAVTAEEVAAIESGDADKYFALLSPDVVFLPQNDVVKAGEELRAWLREFLHKTLIHYLDFRHLETVVRKDVAYHAYTCRWTVAPRAGGLPTMSAFKGVQILRRQPDGSWKISVSIWNSNAPENC